MNAMMPCLASWIYNYFLIIFRVCCGEVRAASLASPGSVFTNTRSRRGTGVSTRDNTVGSYSLDGSLSMKQEYWNESHLEWSTDKLTVWDAQYHRIFPWENEVLWELTRPCTVQCTYHVKWRSLFDNQHNFIINFIINSKISGIRSSWSGQSAIQNVWIFQSS